MSGRQNGDNFKKDDREFEVGGKEGFTESDITSFISDMSDVMGVELGGFTFSDFGSEETSLIQLLGSTKWGKNEKDLTNYPRPTGKLNRDSNTVFKSNYIPIKKCFIRITISLH